MAFECIKSDAVKIVEVCSECTFTSFILLYNFSATFTILMLSLQEADCYWSGASFAQQ